MIEDEFAIIRGGRFRQEELPDDAILSMAYAKASSILSLLHSDRKPGQHRADIKALILKDKEINATASAFRRTYFASIYCALPLTLASLACELWANAKFLAWIGEPSPGNSGQNIPRAVDLIAYLSQKDRTAGDELAASRSFSELTALYGMTCPTRIALCRYFIESALEFVWLHEYGHIFCGHLPVNGQAAIDEIEPVTLALNEDREAAQTKSEFFELMADDFALVYLFNTRPLDGTGDQFALRIISILAAIVVPLVLYISRSFRDANPTVPKGYPPLWVRSQNVLLMERRQARLTPGSNSSRQAFQEHLNKALLSFATIDPVIGEWVGPVGSEEHAKLASSYIEGLRVRALKVPEVEGLLRKRG